VLGVGSCNLQKTSAGKTNRYKYKYIENRLALPEEKND